MVCTCTYTYIQCTDTVSTCMYFVHNHTSFPIRPYHWQPRDASDSQLRAQPVPFGQHPSCHQSPQLYLDAMRCPSASSLSGHQHVAQEQTEHKQLTATSAPSMLRESRYALLLRTCKIYLSVSIIKYKHVYTSDIICIDMYIPCIYMRSTGLYMYTLCIYMYIHDIYMLQTCIYT